MTPDLFSHRYPSAPGAQDTDTSRAAADAIEPRVPRLQRRCLEALSFGDMTADQIARVVGETPFNIRPRCTELNRAGKIEDSGKRRPNGSGRNAIVWRVV